MPFFHPLPDPPEEPERGHATFYDSPWQRPEHWIPALGDTGILLARTGTTAVFLTVDAVYPRGLALELQARVHPDHLADEGLPWQHDPIGTRRSALRFGLAWPDGSRAVAEDGWDPDPTPAAPSLAMAGGGGGGLSWSYRLWLTPLPPAGPVTVHVLWEARDIPETSVEWDLSPFVRRAPEAVELWPLPAPPAEHGWIAYGPPRGGSATVEAASDEGES